MPLLHGSIAALCAVLWVTGAPAPFWLAASALTVFFFVSGPASSKQAVVVLFCAGLVAASFHQSAHKTALQPGETVMTASWTDEWSVKGDRLRGEVTERKTGETVLLSYRLASAEEKAAAATIIPGLSCRLTGSLSAPPQARNPGEFDYRAFLATKQVFHVFEPAHNPLKTCIETNRLRDWPARWRVTLVRHIEETFPEPLAGAAAALLFGERDGLNPDMNDDYKVLGLAHVLAISGLHVTLLTGIVFWVLIRIGVPREQARFLLLFLLPLYALLAGATPPVVRACLMSASLLFFYGRIQPAAALALAFLFMLFTQPFAVYQAGFQLSFLVTFSLILSASHILQQPGSAVLRSLRLSFLAQLAALPSLLWHFWEVSLLSPVANLIFVPFYTLFFMPLLFVMLPVSFVVPITPLSSFANSTLTGINNVAAKLADIEGASLIIGKPSLEAAVGCLVAVWLLFLLWEKTACVFWPLLLSLCMMWMLVGEKQSDTGKVTFLDVGQGDSIVIQLPDGRGTYLIDTGGSIPFEKEAWAKRTDSFSVGEDVVVPFLKREGIRTLDKLMLTHADADHAGAALDVLTHIPADDIIISPGSGKEPLMTSLQQAGHNVRESGAGEAWRAGDASFRFLWPGDRKYEGNNDSLVLYAEMGGKTWLFTGDLEEQGERALIKQYNLSVNILKAGHHGSKTSTSPAFIEAVNPDVAVVSAGQNNRYGHPHASVVDTLQQNGVTLYRTDQNGAVTYQYEGNNGFFQVVIP